jgi:hypothetical protein
VKIELLDFYDKYLVPLTPEPKIQKLLSLLLSGAETTQAYSEILSQDPELFLWARLGAERMGRLGSKNTRADSLVSIHGQNRIRNLIIGRTLERKFIPEEDTLLGLLKHKGNDSTPKAPSKEEKVIQSEELMQIPEIKDFEKYLIYSNRAFNAAVATRHSHPGQAFVAGVLFDYLQNFFRKIDTKNYVTDPIFKKPELYIEEVVNNGIRSALASEEIMKYISISQKRNVFLAALLRNMGKILLLAYDPAGFEKCYMINSGQVNSKSRADSTEAEELEFGWDHAQITSLYIGKIDCLRELEKPLDFHHRPALLKFRSPEMYALSCVLRVSGALNKMYQRHRKDSNEIERMNDASLTKGKEFNFLKIRPNEWETVKKEWAVNIMKVGL